MLHIPDDELLDFEEADEIDWRNYFSVFRERVWPMFQEQGFTFPEAYTAWRLEQVTGRLSNIERILEDDN